jgi:hypothetical protein
MRNYDFQDLSADVGGVAAISVMLRKVSRVMRST